MSDDAELLRQYANSGSNEAFSAFVRGRIDLVYSAALRRTGGDTHLANDVAQRVFSAAAQHAAVLACHPHPTAWLYETTRFTASSFMRTERRRKLRERIQSEEAQLIAESDPPWDRLAPHLDEAIDRLHEGDRAAVLLRFFDGKGFPEIARLLKLTDAGARLRVERALEKLRRILARRGITSTMAGLAVALESQAIGAAPAGLALTLSSSVVSTTGAALAKSGGATVLKSFFIMSTTKTVITVVAVAAIGLASYEVKETRRTEAAFARLTLERDGLAKRMEAESRQNKQLQAQVAILSSRSPNTDRVPGTPLQFGPPNIQALLRDPTYRKLQETTERGQLDGRYASLFKVLRLTPDQLSQLKNLLVAKEMAPTDAAEAAREQGITRTADPEGFNQALSNAEVLVDNEIKTALGDAGYAQYQQYERTQPERGVVDQLQASLGYTPTPLTDDQANQLIEVLKQAAPPQLANSNATITVLVGNGLTLSRPSPYTVSDEALVAAQTVLLPDQLQALRQIQAQQQAQRQMSLLSGGRPPP